MPDGTDKTTANATKTTYDAAGRAVRVERWLGVALRRQAATAVPQDSAVTDWSTQYRKLSTVTGPTVYCVVLVSAPGSAASVTRTQYDDAGRVVYTMDARGSVTGFGYDGAGRRVSATNYLSYAVNPPASGSLVPDNTNVVFVTQTGSLDNLEMKRHT